jgi:hypothetical protein
MRENVCVGRKKRGREEKKQLWISGTLALRCLEETNFSYEGSFDVDYQ